MGGTYKTSVDREVSLRSGVPLHKVAPVLSALYALLREELVSQGMVTIPYVGTLRRRDKKVSQEAVLVQGHFAYKRNVAHLHIASHVCVYFSKSPQLSKAFKENNSG